MRQLVADIEALEGLLVSGHVGNLDWWRCTDEDTHTLATRIRLWFDHQGALVKNGRGRNGLWSTISAMHARATARLIHCPVGSLDVSRLLSACVLPRLPQGEKGEFGRPEAQNERRKAGVS
jgi:hypothetical protein